MSAKWPGLPAFLAHLAIGACLAMPVNTFVQYYFNGRLMAQLPQWDASIYSHAVIMPMDVLGVRFTALLCTTEPFTVSDDGYLELKKPTTAIMATGVIANRIHVRWKWLEGTNDYEAGVWNTSAAAVIWSNYDLVDAAGNVYLKASEPVPRAPIPVLPEPDPEPKPETGVYDDTWPIEWNSLEVKENVSLTYDGQNFLRKISNLVPTDDEMNKSQVFVNTTSILGANIEAKCNGTTTNGAGHTAALYYSEVANVTLVLIVVKETDNNYDSGLYAATDDFNSLSENGLDFKLSIPTDTILPDSMWETLFEGEVTTESSEFNGYVATPNFSESPLFLANNGIRVTINGVSHISTSSVTGNTGSYYVGNLWLYENKENTGLGDNGLDYFICTNFEMFGSANNRIFTRESGTYQVKIERALFEPVAYLYNGVQLPDINTVWTDKETYPYAVVIVEDGESIDVTFAGSTIATVVFASSRPEYNADKNRIICNTPILMSYYTDDNTIADVAADAGLNYGLNEWGTPIAAYQLYSPVEDGKQYWTSYDILNTDGTVYLAASDPVPVYE